MNRGRVRQPGHVAQRYLEIRLIRGARHASHAMSLSGDLASDKKAVDAAVAGLRDALPDLAEDPHLWLPTTVASTSTTRGEALTPSEAIVESVLRAANGHDLVGILAAGPVYRGFANSDGQRNWHATTTFNLEWSLYFHRDKAVKSAYTGFAWSDDALTTRMASATEQLALISRPPKVLAPGKYRTYLAPTALNEVTDLISWGGFSARALATRQSALAENAVAATPRSPRANHRGYR